MARGWKPTLLLAALSLPICAATATQGDQSTIFVRVRHSYAFCTGYCPDYAIRVAPDGKIEATSMWVHDRTMRYMASPAQLAAFRRALAPLRPHGGLQLDATCRQATDADGKPDPLSEPRTDDMEIRWEGARTDRLTGCGTHWDTRKTIDHAVRALGADPLFGGPPSMMRCEGDETSADKKDGSPTLGARNCTFVPG